MLCVSNTIGVNDEWPVKFLRADNELNTIATNSYLKHTRTQAEWITPASHPQNGVSERHIRSICTVARSLLHDSGAPLMFWQDAFRHACYLSNILPSSSNTDEASPYKLVYHREPDVRDLHVFGQR